MKLSIIIPYYNSEKWIARCLDSLLDQDLEASEYEIIVVDDRSQNSVELLKDYVARYPNIKYLRQRNARQSAARNNGLAHALGDYVFFCDSDDYVERNVLASLVSMAKDNELDILFHGVKRLQPDNENYAISENKFFLKKYSSGFREITPPPS